MSDPESLRQARRWDAVKERAIEFGLCHRCASLLAWGHQNGFRSLAMPCDRCAVLVHALPVARSNGWRSVVRYAERPSEWPQAAATGDPGLVVGPTSVAVNRSAHVACTGDSQAIGAGQRHGG